MPSITRHHLDFIVPYIWHDSGEEMCPIEELSGQSSWAQAMKRVLRCLSNFVTTQGIEGSSARGRTSRQDPNTSSG